jgi:hypothetical protein
MLISMPTGTSTIFGVFQAMCSSNQGYGASAPNGGKVTSIVGTAQAHVTAPTFINWYLWRGRDGYAGAAPSTWFPPWSALLQVSARRPISG